MQQEILFSNQQGEKLSGTVHQPSNPTERGVIIGHCFTCSRHTRILQQMGHDLAAAEFMVLRFDFSGNGRSEGAFIDATYSKHIADIKAATAFMAGRGVHRIGLAGHSMGGNIALLAADRMKAVQAVCTLASRLSGLKEAHFLSPHQQIELDRSGRVAFTGRGRALELSKKFFTDADSYDMHNILGSLKKPLLLIHGDQDEIVPVAEALAAHRQNPSAIALKIIPAADHMFSREDHRRQAAEAAVEWFKHRFHNKT